MPTNWRIVHELIMPCSLNTRKLLTTVAEIPASLCIDAEQKYGDRDFGGRKRWLYLSARQKGRRSRIALQELCPPPHSGNRRRFYTRGLKSGVYDKDQSSEGLAFFFFLHYFKTVTAGVRQPGNWVRLSLCYRSATFFLKCKYYKG